MDYSDLTPELRKKAEACTTAEELVALAKAEGVELTDRQLAAITGGYESPSASWDNPCVPF